MSDTAPRKPAMVNNPYAKKRKLAPAAATPGAIASASSVIAGSSKEASSSLPSSFQPVTFSQAFGPNNGPEKQAEHQTVVTNQQHFPSYIDHATAMDSSHDVRDVHKQFQPHVLYVSTRQRGNGLLKYIRNVPIQFNDKVVADYWINTTTCALFLSIKYHQLYPQYIHRRLSELKSDFRLRILLVLVDVDDCANSLLYLNKLGVTNSLTVILAWSEAEAARYLESYKAFDGKDASSIQKRESNNIADQVADFVTACKPCSKTDAATVWQHFGKIRSIVHASKDELALCPGLGPVKVQRLHDALHRPFSKKASRERKRKQQQHDDEANQDNEDQHSLNDQ
jgi:DNA excision repair protein ERCC-1